MSVHDGHRERLKAQYLEHGLDCFNDVNALELLLFFAIPRTDTNPIAHALLDHFGCLEDVLNATVRELEEVPGIGRSAATLITLVRDIYKKGQISQANGKTTLPKIKDIAEYLKPRFINELNEVLLLLCLDTKRRVICCQEISRGTVNEVDSSIRVITEIALRNRASSVVIAHNHPDGDCRASREDDRFTECCLNAMNAVGITLLDHIVFAGDRYMSFKMTGLRPGLL